MTTIVEIVLELNFQFQNNIRKCSAVAYEMECHKKKLIPSWENSVSL